MTMFTHRSVSLPYDENLTLAKILAHRNDNNVPQDAILEYEGCGSHNMHWTWRERMSTEQEVQIREAKAAEQARIEAEEAEDRKAGF